MHQQFYTSRFYKESHVKLAKIAAFLGSPEVCKSRNNLISGLEIYFPPHCHKLQWYDTDKLCFASVL